MTRGAPRKHDPTIPAHIDQTKLPRGLYWDRSGNGRWYVIEDHPDGGPRRKKTVAGPRARLSELHDRVRAATEEMLTQVEGTVAVVTARTQVDATAREQRAAMLQDWADMIDEWTSGGSKG